MISKEGKLASLGAAALFAPVIWWAGAGLLLERVFQVERGPHTAGVLLAGTVVLLAAGLVYGLRLPSDDRHLIMLGAMAPLIILTVTATVHVVIGLGLGISSAAIGFFRPDFSRACLVCASRFYRVWLPGVGRCLAISQATATDAQGELTGMSAGVALFHRRAQ